MTVLFELGRIVSTRGVYSWAQANDGHEHLHDCLLRHARGDWGTVDGHDQLANDRALRHGTRLLSCYALDPKGPYGGDNRLWIITEWDRSVTTLLLPEEY